MNRNLDFTFLAVLLIVFFAISLNEIKIDSNAPTIFQSPTYNTSSSLQKQYYIKLASDFLIGKVGEEYFQKYFKVNMIATGQPTKGYAYMVLFDYNIICDGINATCPVDIFFDGSNAIVRERGIPAKDNLMPFRVSMTEALNIAEAHKLSEVVYNVTVGIQYPTNWAGAAAYRYVWSVDYYLTPRDSASGNIRNFFIDPITGELLGTEITSWRRLS
jgi:hypothetical protein